MKLIKNYLLGILCFGVIVTFNLFIVSTIFAYTKIEDRFIESGIFLSLAIAAFISSFILCRNLKKKGIVHGVVINAISIGILYIISCFLNGSFVLTNTVGIYFAICCLSGIVGGILGVNV